MEKNFPSEVARVGDVLPKVLVAQLLTEIELVSGNDNRITQDNYIMINSTGLQHEKNVN